MEDPEFVNALTSAGSNIRSIQGQSLVDFIAQQDEKNTSAMESAGLKQAE